MKAEDLRSFLENWPYDAKNNFRIARGEDGREIILVRQPMGLEQYEVDGRPDGQRPYGMDSTLGFQLSRLAAAKNADAENVFKLSAENCAELFAEGILYYHRFVTLFRLKEWVRAERDTARTLRLIDFVKQHADHEEDRAQLEQWRPDIARMNAVARAMILLEKNEYNEALKITSEGVLGVDRMNEHLESCPQLAAVLLRKLDESLAVCPTFRARDESAFRRQGDYWTITYQQQVARLKATRGLHCLACLLSHPRREFHVGELVAQLIGKPSIPAAGGHTSVVWQSGRLYDAGPILDPRAKAEYKRRIDDLRRDLEEAEKFNDPDRAARSKNEMNIIAEQLASAVGLGGRDRKSASEAERARSAVTKRIKKSINKIAEAIPALGRHLSARIKTGYFCSYNPHPDRPVAWKF
jgi:hypothetical protein